MSCSAVAKHHVLPNLPKEVVQHIFNSRWPVEDEDDVAVLVLGLEDRVCKGRLLRPAFKHLLDAD